MLKDRMVRVKLIKRYHEQRPQSFVGKVTAFNDAWIVMDAKGLMLCRNLPNSVQIDPRTAPVVIARDNIESVRVLPDNFDMNNIQITTEGQQLRLVVPNAASCFIGEMGEG